MSAATSPTESGISLVRRAKSLWCAEDWKSEFDHHIHPVSAFLLLSHRGSGTDKPAYLRVLWGDVPWHHVHRGDAETDPLLRPQSAAPMCPDLHFGPARLPSACWLWREDLTGFGIHTHTYTHIHTHTHTHTPTTSTVYLHMCNYFIPRFRQLWS